MFGRRDVGVDAHDIAQRHAGLAEDCETELRAVVDPEAADALAKSDQAAKIAEFGGREAILGRGSFAYSPAPGTEAVYN